MNEAVNAFEERMIEGMNSMEREVRVEAVKRLAQIWNKMGEQAFRQAVNGKLNSSQISMVKTASVMYK